MNEKIRKTRNKPTHYDKDIHIRVPYECYEGLRIESDKQKITLSLLTRNILEEYTRNIEINK